MDTSVIGFNFEKLLSGDWSGTEFSTNVFAGFAFSQAKRSTLESG